jgi:hypothetical protein|tara:strand:+ start:3073 stop:3462 length:390 start_codon:yes stop_codon:yes gene_type:complete
MDKEKVEWMQENYPFFSYVRYGNKKEFTEHLGIIINSDQVITSMYNFEAIPSPELRKKFVELGEQWWWESNRLMPINLFLGTQIAQYKNWILNMNSKDVEVIWGPTTSLANIIQKRIKRRSVQLVRKID